MSHVHRVHTTVVQADVPSFSGQSYAALPMISKGSVKNLVILFKPTQRGIEERVNEAGGTIRSKFGGSTRHRYILSSAYFMLLIDNMNRIELRYLCGGVNCNLDARMMGKTWSSHRTTFRNNHIHNNHNKPSVRLIRVMGNRDVKPNAWNKLIITDNVSSLSGAPDNEIISIPNESLNEIVLIIPDPIQINKQTSVGGTMMDGRTTALDVDIPEETSEIDNNLINKEHARHSELLFLAGIPRLAKSWDRSNEKSPSHLNAYDLHSENISGFKGCIWGVKLNDRIYRLKSDLRGDILDAFDIGKFKNNDPIVDFNSIR